MPNQHAKRVVSDTPGLLDFAIGLVNPVINLPNGQVKFFEEFKLQKNCEVNLLIKTFLGLVEMMFGLVNVQLARISSCKNDFLCTLLFFFFFCTLLIMLFFCIFSVISLVTSISDFNTILTQAYKGRICINFFHNVQ